LSGKSVGVELVALVLFAAGVVAVEPVVVYNILVVAFVAFVALVAAGLAAGALLAVAAGFPKYPPKESVTLSYGTWRVSAILPQS